MATWVGNDPCSWSNELVRDTWQRTRFLVTMDTSHKQTDIGEGSNTAKSSVVKIAINRAPRVSEGSASCV